MSDQTLPHRSLPWLLLLSVAVLLLLSGCGRTALDGQCSIDLDCPGQLICLDGVCQVEEPDSDTDGNGDTNGDGVGDGETPECSDDLDCGDGVCRVGGSSCQLDRCNQQTGRCEVANCDPTCESGFEAVNCRCLPVACELNQDCQGRVCDDGSCRSCDDDLECSDDGSLVCESGLCVEGPECRSDDECRGFQVCTNEVCVDRPQCTFDADCAGDQQQCIAGVCTFTPACVDDDDCTAQSECVGGSCQPRFCRGNSECPGDQLCDAGNCIDPPVSVDCIVVTDGQTIAPNERIPLEAFAFNDVGQGLAATFLWASSNPGVAAIEGNELVGGATTGTTTVTASLAGGDPLACGGSPQFQNLGLTPADELRVRVVNMETGAPIEGASVYAGNSTAVSNNLGIATLPLPQAPFDVSVFHDSFNYLTVKGVSARDLRLPVGRRSGTGPVAGFTGEFDVSAINTSGDIQIGIAGGSLAGDLLDVNLERLLGDPFVTDFSIPGLGGADVPLPGGVTAHGQIAVIQIEGKKRYYAQSAAGPRLAWGIAGKIPFQALLGIFTNPPDDIGGAIATFLPLFSRFDHAQQPMILAALPRVLDVIDINNNGITNEWLPDYNNFPVEDLQPSVRQQLSTEISISSLPELDGSLAPAAVLVGGTLLDGPGFVPLGISATSDQSGDGQPDNRVMYMAPQYGSAVGGRYAVLAIAFGAGGTGGFGGDFSVALWNGQTLSPSISLGTFPDSSTGTITGRTVAIDATAGPIFRIRLVGSERSWDVWSMGPPGQAGEFSHSVTLPTPPSGRADIFAGGGPILVDSIRTSVSMDDLVRASGVGLRRAGLVTTSFNRTTFR